MRLYTNPTYANRKLHLPLVGPTQLDKDASFDVDDKTATKIVELTASSLKFVASKEDLRKKAPAPEPKDGEQPQYKTKVTDEEILESVVKRIGKDKVLQLLGAGVEEPEKTSETTTKPLEKQKPKDIKKEQQPVKDEQPAKEQEEFVGDVEVIKDAIEAASADELLGLVEYIPGIDLEAAKTLGEPELRAFLLKKLDEASSKK